MTNIAFFSDIHIHPHSSSYDKLINCLDCLDWVYKESIKRGCKYIFFGGDLFHTRDRINIFAYHKTWNILKKYSDKIKSYYILGNHDIYYKYSTVISSVEPLSALIDVISSPTTIEIDGL